MTEVGMDERKRTLDQLFRLLADRHRRYTLYYLDETETDVVTLDEVAEYVVERSEPGRNETEQPADSMRERIRLALHHNHLPRLAKAGLIDYDARSQTVRNWAEPSLMAWAQSNQRELPQLRSVFCTSVSG